MTYVLPLVILVNCLMIQGILEWTVVGKVTEYGQNVTLFCNVPNCCPKDAGWDRWTPVQQTLFIDVKTGRPNKKYDGKVLKDGYTLIIQNFTKNDLNVSYSCLYGVTLGEIKYLLEEDVFIFISTTHPNVTSGLSKGELAALITGVIVLVSVSVIISICVWRRLRKKGNDGEKFKLPEVDPLIKTQQGEVIPRIMKIEQEQGDVILRIINIENEQEEVIPRIVIIENEQEEVIPRIVKIENEQEEVIPRIVKIENEHEEVIPRIVKIENEQEEVIPRILKIENERKEAIPKHIRDQIQNHIKDWEENDKMFVSTRASDYVMEYLQQHSCLTLTAPSGVGKSFIARHTALGLKKDGYNIIPVYSPTDIRDYYQQGRQTVFIVDDICGNFTANQQQIDNWKQLLPVINKIIADKCCKIIVSCRLQVYKDDKFKKLLPFKSCECNLISDTLGLTFVEKRNIAKTYISTSMTEIDDLISDLDFFPLLCSLYNENREGNTKEFFKNPFDVYKKELDRLSENGDDGNYTICSLALCVLFNNNLEEIWFQGKVTNEQRNIIEDTCNACKLNRGTSKAKLKDVLDTLDGTFICKHNGIYKTLHDKLFDLLAHYFGQKMIECLIDHGDSDLVRERFIWQTSLDDKNTYMDYIIQIPDDYLKSYLKRLVKDWSAGKVEVVFGNKNMKASSFRQQLIQFLQQLDTLQQVTLANIQDTVTPQDECNSGITPLLYSCHSGYTDLVQWMLYNNVDVDGCTDTGTTGLIMASFKGHTGIVRLLLEKNPDVSLCTIHGSSPLYLASVKGHTDIVRLLLERNPNVDICTNTGSSSLFIASLKGHTGIVRLLLERNPDVDMCESQGYSPLLIATQERNTDIVKLLLDQDPNVDICSNTGYSPLLMATHKGYTDIVKLLLEKDPNVDLCDQNGRSPLYQATMMGHTDIVKLLLDKDPNVDLCDQNGRSPLCKATHNGYTDIVKLLLDKDPNVDLCDQNGHSPLCKATMMGHTDIVKLLLEKDSNIDLCDKDGRSPLYWAICGGNTVIVKLLLEGNPNVDLCDNKGVTPLILSCLNNQTSIVQLLIKHKPNINAQALLGCNAIYYSLRNGNVEITQLLLENNADCNMCIHSKQVITDTFNNHSKYSLQSIKHVLFESLIKNTPSNVKAYITNKSVEYAFDVAAGSSPLHIACFKGMIDDVRSLLDHNAIINITKEDGTTPLFYACEVGHEDIVCLLLDKGAYTQICRLDGKSNLKIATDNGRTSIVMMLTNHTTTENILSS